MEYKLLTSIPSSLLMKECLNLFEVGIFFVVVLIFFPNVSEEFKHFEASNYFSANNQKRAI